MAEAKNVLGEPLAPCCTRPTTGFFRNEATELFSTVCVTQRSQGRLCGT